ncbi:MAG: hypothetical protein SFU98_23065 [Leptospiraceae bacterium]|nr:hypothetical protein [Leptospiraceae bacterium]
MKNHSNSKDSILALLLIIIWILFPTIGWAIGTINFWEMDVDNWIWRNWARIIIGAVIPFL